MGGLRRHDGEGSPKSVLVRYLTNQRTNHKRPAALLCAGFLIAMAVAMPAAAEPHDTTNGTSQTTATANGCEQDGKNTQCNDLGSIAMDTQREIRGELIEVKIDLTIDDTHTDQGARYIMFSVRHDGSSSPVSLSIKSFDTSAGPIFAERIDHDRPNEINIWTHVADIPEGKPIDLVVTVGANDKGAFQLETLVMPFDRGYEPVRERGGAEVTLFSFTMLGVNEPSGDVNQGSGLSLVDRVRTPGPSVPALLGGLFALAFIVARRNRA